ncbi:predicted protein [Coccidioides posadasii str. Silveira]|uniref:Predicted protein n=1 Tax=Coccidioides posadasii (strain RMSCC 757 / Silveira) TaxID=443226 RepID=E9DGQ1_COCPS|nr:predicted protein [Coccidioides posadasii str. Silveira]
MDVLRRDGDGEELSRSTCGYQRPPPKLKSTARDPPKQASHSGMTTSLTTLRGSTHPKLAKSQFGESLWAESGVWTACPPAERLLVLLPAHIFIGSTGYGVRRQTNDAEENGLSTINPSLPATSGNPGPAVSRRS